MLPKKRCRICRRLFRPDPRVGERQRVCSDGPCQVQRRAQTQARWRKRNPSYQRSYRTKRRVAVAEDAQKDKERRVSPPPPLRRPAGLTSFPWELAEPALGFAGAELLTILAILMVRLVNESKDEKIAEKPFPIGVYAPSGRDP